MESKKLKKVRRRTTAAAAAVIAATGAAVGGSFDSPAELLGLDTDSAVVDSLFDTGDGDETAEGESAGAETKDSRFRRRVASLPLEVRAAVGVPLWCIGWLVISGFTALWGSVLSPVASVALRWVLAAGIMLAVLAGTMKLACPGMPLKTVFNKKSILTVLIGIALLWLADLALGLLLPDKRWLRELVGFVGTLATFGAAAVPLIRAELRRREAQKNAPPRPETPEEKEKRLRRLALEMADAER